MKSTYLIPLILGLICATTASAQTLIDGTAASGYVNNGSFESITGSAPDLWVPLPGSDANFQVAANNAHDGVNSIAIGFDNQVVNPDDRSIAMNTNQNTGYTIGLGDSYDLSFWTYGAFGWTASETLTWNIFYTDDNTLTGVTNTTGTLGGTATTLFTGTVSPTPGNNSANYAEATNISATVADANAVGKHLWFAIASSQETNAYARVDQVGLAAVSIPEPSTIALLSGIAVLLVVAIRRRR